MTTRRFDTVKAGDCGLEGANELKTTSDLFRMALQGDYDDDGAWEAVHILRLRNTPEWDSYRFHRLCIRAIDSTTRLRVRRSLP